jgi:hypothetical protein
MVSSFTRFLDPAHRRTTIGRNPLYEWSARRRALYLTTHNTQNRQIAMPPPSPPGGFQTQNLSRQRVTDLHLRPAILTYSLWKLKRNYNEFSTIATDGIYCISSMSRMTIHCYSLLQLNNSITVINIPTAIGLRFLSSQFNGSCNDGCVTSRVIDHCLIFRPSLFRSHLVLPRMIDFPYRRCHRCSVTDNQIHCHRLYYTNTLLSTVHTCCYSNIIDIFIYFL